MLHMLPPKITLPPVEVPLILFSNPSDRDSKIIIIIRSNSASAKVFFPGVAFLGNLSNRTPPPKEGEA